MKPWLKAGLAGAVLEIIFTLPSLLLFVTPAIIGSIATSCASVAYLLVLPLVGVLAGLWMQKPAPMKSFVTQGALAGLLASVIDGVFTVALAAFISVSGLLTAYVEWVMPGANRNEFLGMFLSLPGYVITTSVCVIGNILFAVGLSVAGAVIYAAIVQKKTAQAV